MKKNLFLIYAFVEFLSQKAIATHYVEREEPMAHNGKFETYRRSTIRNPEEDVETADLLFYTLQENAGEQAFDIYVKYYERSPEVCGFFEELDSQILPSLIEGRAAEAKERFLKARKERISKR